MFCASCGKELPDDANFCIKCGKPQRADVQAAQVQMEVPRWETCEIKYHIVKGHFWANDSSFVAEAVGPSGLYWADESATFKVIGVNAPLSNDKDAATALTDLIKKLSQDGWDHTGSGITWYNHTFRRHLK